MECYHCKKKSKAAWLHLKDILTLDDDEHSEIYSDKYICGYSCYKRLSESNQLPKDLWSHIVNKEDYIGLIRPISSKSQKKFEYLSENEIVNLGDREKETYYMKEQEKMIMNPLSYEIHKEIMEEDKYTSYIENMNSGDEFIEDY